MNEKLTVFDITLKDRVLIKDTSSIMGSIDLTEGETYEIVAIRAETEEFLPSIAVIDDVGDEMWIKESEFGAVEFV